MKHAEPKIRLKILSRPRPDLRKAIVTPLVGFNTKAGLIDDYKMLAIPVEHSKTGRVVGGLWGYTWAGWLYVELLFLPKAMRGNGLGTRILRLAEAEAVRRGCVAARLETFSFQARPFYEGLGYRAFGAIRFRPGHTLYFMQKRLPPRAKRSPGK